MMCREEAARMWDRREREWKREKEARQRLMNEVIITSFTNRHIERMHVFVVVL